MKTIYEFLLKSKTSVSTQHTDYVDFDLPSGLLWARCNIGANEPYERGDYFMWGSIEPNTNKSCKPKYMPFNNGSDDYDGDYFESIKNKVCPNEILAPEYDAATVILGDGWRLPTEDEFQELIDNTKHEWINNYNDSKVNGMLFEANYAELFIPTSGYRSLSSFYYKGNYGGLWSSSLHTSNPNYARYLTFDDSSCYTYYDNRCVGFCLRGVKNKNKSEP